MYRHADCGRLQCRGAAEIPSKLAVVQKRVSERTELCSEPLSYTRQHHTAGSATALRLGWRRLYWPVIQSHASQQVVGQALEDLRGGALGCPGTSVGVVAIRLTARQRNRTQLLKVWSFCRAATLFMITALQGPLCTLAAPEAAKHWQQSGVVLDHKAG